MFTVAVALALVHALDDAFVHRGPGLGLGQHALAGADRDRRAASPACSRFPSLRPGLRAALAFSFGGLALVNGVLHVAAHRRSTARRAATSPASLAAAAGARAARARRRDPVAPPRRGHVEARSIALPAGLLAVVFVLGPVGLGIVETHKWREPVGDPPSAAYHDVTFEATDGARLAGWYRPSANGAAVLVVHGGGSDRKGAVAHARMLARRGYGVLLYDARGRGESDGSPNATAGTGPRTSPARSTSSSGATTSTRPDRRARSLDRRRRR